MTNASGIRTLDANELGSVSGGFGPLLIGYGVIAVGMTIAGYLTAEHIDKSQGSAVAGAAKGVQAAIDKGGRPK